MQTETKRTKGPKPTHRLWLVEDQGHADPAWTELAALWPTKDGKGFTGRLVGSNVFPAGARLVILPAKTAKQGGAA